MNGDSLQLYNKLKENFSVLKTQFDERWEAHNQSSAIRAQSYCSKFDEVKDAIADMSKKIGKLPCARHTGDLKATESKVNFLEKLVVVVIILGIVLGVWVRYATTG